MSAVDAAARSLLESAEALEQALMRGDDESEALAARLRAFDAFRTALAGPLGPDACALVERVVEIDRRALARANGQLGAVGAELGRAHRSRRALSSLDPQERAPRFFSERA